MMRTLKDTNVLLGVTLILLLSAALTVSGLLGISNRRLDGLNKDLRARLQEAIQQQSNKTSLIAETQVELKTVQKINGQLQSELSMLKALREEALKTAVPQPYRVETFLGKHHLGQAWITPQNIRTNQETGLVSYEPIVLLNENLKTYFTEYRTNTVERQIASYSTQNSRNYNYYPAVTPYYYATPSYFQPSPILSNNSATINSSKPKSAPSTGGFMPIVKGGSGAWSTPFTGR